MTRTRRCQYMTAKGCKKLRAQNFELIFRALLRPSKSPLFLLYFSRSRCGPKTCVFDGCFFFCGVGGFPKSSDLAKPLLRFTERPVFRPCCAIRADDVAKTFGQKNFGLTFLSLPIKRRPMKMFLGIGLSQRERSTQSPTTETVRGTAAIKIRNQEKGVLAKGVSANSSVTPKIQNYPRILSQQYIWHSERHSQERHTRL